VMALTADLLLSTGANDMHGAIAGQSMSILGQRQKSRSLIMPLLPASDACYSPVPAFPLCPMSGMISLKIITAISFSNECALRFLP
jgi:hypothetical protein